MKVSQILAIILALISLSLPACNLHKEEQSHEEQNKIVVTSPMAQDVIITQQYVCQIRSQRQSDVAALAEGYLLEIPVKEGQAVNKGDVMFKIFPTLYQTKYDAEVAEVQLAQLEFNNTAKLAEDNAGIRAVSPNEVLLYKAKLAKAVAKMKQAETELNFTTVRAQYDGIIDRLLKQQGSLIKKDDILTTLSDNSVMWVYYNVPEARYLEVMAELRLIDKVGHQTTRESQLTELNRRLKLELVLADGRKFPQIGTIGAIEGLFNNETGNIAFRADFSNPHRLLRHGQTGKMLVHRTLKKALLIPQRATYEILDKRYVYVVDKEDVAHQREITIHYEKDDIFVIEKGLETTDRIVLEGGRQVHDGEKVEEFEFRTPEKALSNQKNPAE